MTSSRIAAVAVLVALLVVPLVAQPQARVRDDASAAASQFAPAVERVAQALAQQVTGAGDSGSRWISGRLSSLEPAAQLRDFADAVAREPNEALFVASLADACMGVYSPVPTPCSDRDTVGYWSSRDADNAVPWLLQAERARRRNNVASMIDNLDRASRSARYDDYAGRAGALIAARLVPHVAVVDRPAALLYAHQQASTPLGAPLAALETVCAAQTRALDERVGRACIRLGALMAERARSFASRRAGSQIAAASVPTDSARAATSEAARTTVALQDRCREAIGTFERLAVGSSAQRERAIAAMQRFLEVRAKEGEAAACERLAEALAVR